MSKSLKLVVIGDGAVGKTCLLVVYAKGEFPVEYVPTVFENYRAKVDINNKEYTIQLWDTAGQEELEGIRTLSYANTDIFLLCFSVVDKTSFENVKNKWLEEIKHYSKDPTLLLVGTKTDLRGTPNTENVTEEEARAMAKAVGAFDYVECSALKCEGVKDVFDKAIVRAVDPPPGESGCCNVA